MNTQYKSKKGDISLLVTLLVCSIILILLAPLAQKVSVESKISRENLMSQQAVQAAKTGIDAWLYNFVNSTGAPSNIPLTTLDSTLGIQYQVKFIPRSGSTPARIKSTGRVNRSGFTIERTLEDTRDDL
jgi:type II secretory pathway pseudopilin PulG